MMNFPRYLYAIGGAGKEIVYTMMKNEWILREILRPKLTRTEVKIIIIDTALDEENYDLEKISELEEKRDILIKEFESDLSSAGSFIGDIDYEYILLTKKMILQSPYDLVGIGDDIKKATEATIWWLNDDQIHEDWHKTVMKKENFKNRDFAKGVYRKRAIGKAIYYKALSKNLLEIDLPESTTVDIICGMGGGTGSGMAFDLAQELKNIQPTANINLYSILSTLAESPDEKANCFAMISELEYSSLNGNSPFEEIILVPMEVTNYPGQKRVNDVNKRLLKEFDEVFPYILISYHNHGAQMIFQDIPSFAPFIIAVPQLIRYNVEYIKSIKSNIIEKLQLKEISLNEEQNIYSAVNKYFDEFYNDGNLIENGALVDEDKSFINEERFSKFRMIIDHDFFKKFEYNSVQHLKKALDNGIRRYSADEIENQISSVKAEVDAISIPAGDFRDDVDSLLYNILLNDIQNIEKLKHIFNKINTVRDIIIKETLKSIVKTDTISLGIKLHQIRTKIDDLNNEEKDINADLMNLENGLKNYENEIKENIENNNKEWKLNIDYELNKLDSIDVLNTILINNFKILTEELAKYANEITSQDSTKKLKIISDSEIQEIIDEIKQKMESIGLDYTGEKKIIFEALNDLKALRKAQIKYKRKIPLIHKIFGIIHETKMQKNNKEAIEAIIRLESKFNNTTQKIFKIKEDDLSSEYYYDIGGKINGYKNELISNIINKIEYKNANQDLFLILKTNLHNSDNRHEANIKKIMLSHLEYEEIKRKKEIQLEEKKNELNIILNKINNYQGIETVLTITNPNIRNHSEYLKDFHSYIINLGKDLSAKERAKKDAFRYTIEMQPSDIFKSTSSGANINSLLEDQNEEFGIKRNILDCIDNTIDPRYNVLLRRVFETEDKQKRWEKSSILNTFVTRAEIDSDFADTEDKIKHAFSLSGEDNFSATGIPYGDDWGIGIVLFIAGIPSDNINNFVDPGRGYYYHYDKIKQNPDKMIFFHHSLMLQYGKYINRKNVFNLEKENDKKLFLQADKDVKLMLSNNFEELNLKDE